MLQPPVILSLLTATQTDPREIVGPSITVESDARLPEFSAAVTSNIHLDSFA
jgi:hypothetical protein